MEQSQSYKAVFLVRLKKEPKVPKSWKILRKPGK